MGKSALSSSSPRAEEQGRGARRRRPGAGGLGLEGGRNHGEKGSGALGVRFPSPISEKGSCRSGRGGHGRGGRLRPWAARAGAARGEQAWSKGREGRKEPSAPPTLGRGDTNKRGDGSGGGVL